MNWIEEARKRIDSTQELISQLSKKGGSSVRISSVGAQSDTDEGTAIAVIKGNRIMVEVAVGEFKSLTPMITLVRMGDGRILIHPGDYNGVPKYGLVRAGVLYNSHIGDIKKGLGEIRNNLRNKD